MNKLKLLIPFTSFIRMGALALSAPVLRALLPAIGQGVFPSGAVPLIAINLASLLMEETT